MADFTDQNVDVEGTEDLQLRFQDLLRDCTTLQSEKLDIDEVQLLSRVNRNCQNSINILKNSKGKLNKETSQTLVRNFAQAIMDDTYVMECRLVNQEFPEANYKLKMSNILAQLALPVDVAMNMPPTCARTETKVEEILGTEMLECLHWRKGALMYMLCHTVFNDTERWKRNTVDFLKDCECGVKFLQSMLCVRTPLSHVDSLEIRDYDTATLLSQGIFSDTHMLGLMYAGELCYWYWTTLQRSNKELVRTDELVLKLDSATKGQHFLGKFIETCKGPLRGKGWDCRKAEQLLHQIRK